MSAPDPRTHTDAVLAQLQTNAAGLAVGDQEAPLGTGGKIAPYPYLVLFPIPVESVDGSLQFQDLNSDHWLAWQVTAVGETREQADGALQEARLVLDGTKPPTPAGRRWMGYPQMRPSGPSQRQDDGQPPVYLGFDTYVIPSSPA